MNALTFSLLILGLLLVNNLFGLVYSLVIITRIGLKNTGFKRKSIRKEFS